MPEQQSFTPHNIGIKPRNREHDITEALGRDWFDNNAFATAWHNALSITFPLGEKFFIDSVRQFSDQITDPKLQEEIRGFYGQEGFHRREHERYNQLMCDQRGYDLPMLEERVRKRIAESQSNLPPIGQLAITVALEHITAVMAEFHLAEHSPAKNRAVPVMEQLWMWHAAEEMEHKSVAFDVYRAVGGSEELRMKVMRRVLLLIAWRVFTNMLHMYHKDGNLFSLKLWRQGYQFIWGSKGLIRHCKPSYLRFFKEGFHPWDNDTTEMLASWSDLQVNN